MRSPSGGPADVSSTMWNPQMRATLPEQNSSIPFVQGVNPTALPFGEAPTTRHRGRGSRRAPRSGAWTRTRRFSVLEITSGLPDDSREEDERAGERRLHELRARVKVARAAVATTPGLAETLARDWQKAGRFYTRFGITEAV
jgi:hypothetical protein